MSRVLIIADHDGSQLGSGTSRCVTAAAKLGAARHLERRATGRKGASPALVVRGSVRVMAAVASRLQPFTEKDTFAS